MARVIKQGKCQYHFLRQDQGHVVGNEGREDASFSSLSGLIPKGDERGQVVEDGPGPGSETGEEAGESAGAILEEARSEARLLKHKAQEILDAAKARATEIESQAYAQGYEQGQKDGEEIGRRQFEVGLQHLESVLENFKEETRRLARKYEAQMLQTCLLVAGRLIEKEISEDRELVSRLLVISMEKVVEGSTVVIHIHPRDRENLPEDLISNLASPGGNRIEIRGDASVSRGGCLIETEFGLIDASVESRWLAIVEAINETLRERTGIELDERLKKLPL